MRYKRRFLKLVKDLQVTSEPPKYSDKLKEEIWQEWDRMKHLPEDCYDYKYGVSFIYKNLRLLEKLNPVVEYYW